MLASITPLGERGRHGHWWITFGALLLGAAGTGAVAGAVIGAAGALVIPADLSVRGRLGMLALALAVAFALDAIPTAVPGPRRQVNERWLDEYRGWVYGLGYGVQFGLPVTTVVSSAATYVALLAAFLVGGAGPGALVLGAYGLIRGLTPLAAARVLSPHQLVSLHARLARWRPISVRAGLIALVAIATVSLAGSMA